jgi:aerobic C4-dicarboxylate transport protein
MKAYPMSPAITPKAATPLWQHLYIQVIVAIILGILIGHFSPETGVALKPLGDGFIKLVKMIIAPVIFVSIVTGIGNISEMKIIGRIGIKAFSYFLFASTLALIIGMVVANVFQPGSGMNVDVAKIDASKIADFASTAEQNSVVGFLLDVIPKTFVGAMTSGELLPVLLISILFGIAAAAVGDVAKPVMTVIDSATHIIFKVVAIIMRAAPIGAFGAMAFTIGQYGIGSIANLAELIALFYATSLVFVFGILGLIMRLMGFSILGLTRYLKSELLLVFGTSSSEPAMPSLIEKMERAGCDKSVVGLVVPTGYSFNMDGINIYMTLAALFIAQATNVQLSFQQQIMLLLVAMISSKGTAGVTGAGFITLAATLSIVPDVPVAGMALILGIDRFMSECRSLTNFMGNAVATVVVSAWEGALDRERFNRAMAGEALPTAPNLETVIND